MMFRYNVKKYLSSLSNLSVVREKTDIVFKIPKFYLGGGFQGGGYK